MKLKNEKTWPNWQDCLGNTYQAGDIVAIAIINGKSPQLIIARVEKINRVNSSGEEITTRKFFEHDKPIPQKVKRKRWIADPVCGNTSSLYPCNLTPGHNGRHDHWSSRGAAGHMEEYEHEYLEQGEYREVPSCSVQATPLVDARHFSRYGKDKEGNNRKVTYQIPENILKIEKITV